jgi:hypothetical protein
METFQFKELVNFLISRAVQVGRQHLSLQNTKQKIELIAIWEYKHYGYAGCETVKFVRHL